MITIIIILLFLKADKKQRNSKDEYSTTCDLYSLNGCEQFFVLKQNTSEMYLLFIISELSKYWFEGKHILQINRISKLLQR